MTSRLSTLALAAVIIFAVGCYVGWVGHAGAWEWLSGQWRELMGVK